MSKDERPGQNTLYPVIAEAEIRKVVETQSKILTTAKDRAWLPAFLRRLADEIEHESPTK